MLQSFGTELAETELPDDMYSIERILALRTEKYYQLKVCLISDSPACFQPLFAQQDGISGVWLPVCLVPTPPSLPCVCMCWQTRSMTISVCYPYVSHPLKQITLPASSKLSQLPPPCWLQKLVSTACSSRGLCPSRWQELRHLRVRVPRGIPSTSPLRLEEAARKHHRQVGGMVRPQVPPPDAASLAGLKGTVLGSIQGEDFVWAHGAEHSRCDPCLHVRPRAMS